MLRPIATAAWAALAACALAACGSPPPPPGSPIEVHLAAAGGPRIPNGAIFAANDLDTLRALVDAAEVGLAQQLGAAVVTHACRPPYTSTTGSCWPDQASRPGRAYVALDIQGGFCETEGAPRLGVSGTHLVLHVDFSEVFGCHAAGVLALPTASLVSFPTDGLRPGLYAVSYLFNYPKDSYRSYATYLSIPGPAPGAPDAMDREAAAALTAAIGPRPAGVFSVARVDGTQVGGLCGRTVAGPAYLVTYERDLDGTPRHMTVVLAGTEPTTCATTPV